MWRKRSVRCRSDKQITLDGCEGRSVTQRNVADAMAVGHKGSWTLNIPPWHISTRHALCGFSPLLNTHKHNHFPSTIWHTYASITEAKESNFAIVQSVYAYFTLFDWTELGGINMIPMHLFKPGCRVTILCYPCTSSPGFTFSSQCGTS